MTLAMAITLGVVGFGFILCDIRLLIRKRKLKKRRSAKILDELHDSAQSADHAIVGLTPSKSIEMNPLTPGNAPSNEEV